MLSRAQSQTNLDKWRSLGDHQEELVKYFGYWLAVREWNLQLFHQIPEFGETCWAGELKLYVPDEQWAKFCFDVETFMESTGLRICLNERGGKEFSFFLDIDDVEAEDYQEAILGVMTYLKRDIPDVLPYNIVVWARQVDGLYRFHVHVPHMKVTVRRAKKLVEGLTWCDHNVYESVHCRVAATFKLVPGRDEWDPPYTDCFYFQFNEEEVTEIDFPDNERLRTKIFLSLLHFTSNVHSSEGLEWWHESEGHHRNLQSPIGGVGDPDLYTVPWWDLSRPEKGDLLSIVREEVLRAGAEEGFEKADLDRLFVRVFAYFDRHFTIVRGKDFRVFYRSRPTVYEDIDFTTRSMKVREVMNPTAQTRSGLLATFPEFRSVVSKRVKTNKRNADGTPVFQAKAVKVEWLKEWVDAGHSKVFDGVTRASVKAPPYLFNLYNGPGIFQWQAYNFVRNNPLFAIQAVDLFRSFLREVICCDPNEGDSSAPFNRVCYRVILHLLINEVQTPSKKFLWIVYLFNEIQGVGKSHFLTMLRFLAGQHGTFATVNLDQVLGRFGGYSTDKHLILYEEVDADAYRDQDWKQMWARLKMRTTEKTTRTEKKHQDLEDENLQDTHVISSNNVFGCDSNDRRLFPFTVHPRHKGDADYWEKLVEVLFEKEGWKAVSMWVSTLIPDPNFTTTVEPPKGKTKQQFILRGESPLVRLLFEWTKRGCDINTLETIPSECGHWETKEEKDAKGNVVKTTKVRVAVHDNDAFWEIRDNDLANNEGWYTCFSLDSLFNRIGKDNNIGKTKLKRELADFFAGVDGFEFFNSGRIRSANKFQDGVWVLGKLQYGIYVHLPPKAVVEEMVEHRLMGRPLPQINIPNEDYYRAWWRSLVPEVEVGYQDEMEE